MPKAKKEVLKKTVKKVVEPDLTTMEGVAEYYNLEYRPGVSGLVDIAKQLGAHYEDGYTLEQVVEQAPKKK